MCSLTRCRPQEGIGGMALRTGRRGVRPPGWSDVRDPELGARAGSDGRILNLLRGSPRDPVRLRLLGKGRCFRSAMGALRTARRSFSSSGVVGKFGSPEQAGAPWPLVPVEDSGLQTAESQERGIGGAASRLCGALGRGCQHMFGKGVRRFPIEEASLRVKSPPGAATMNCCANK